MWAVYILLVFAIAGAFIALEVRDLLSSVIAVGAVGLGLSLVFLILMAPDVAITQYIVEIVSVVILIRATACQRGESPDAGARNGTLNFLVAAGFVGVFLAAAWWAMAALPPFGEPLMRVAQTYVDQGLVQTGAANVVASVILDYRAYDTLGEATVLVTAALGVLAVVRRTGRKPGTTLEGPP